MRPFSMPCLNPWFVRVLLLRSFLEQRQLVRTLRAMYLWSRELWRSLDSVSEFVEQFLIYLFYFWASLYRISIPKHDTFGICRYGPISYPSHSPFFCDPIFYPNPPKIWDLPSYANDTAIELASGSYRIVIPNSYPSSCLEFCDIKALKSDREVFSDGS